MLALTRFKEHFKVTQRLQHRGKSALVIMFPVHSNDVQGYLLLDLPQLRLGQRQLLEVDAVN